MSLRQKPETSHYYAEEAVVDLHCWPEKPLVMPHTLIRPGDPYTYDLGADGWGVVLAGEPHWVGRIADENYRDEWLEPEVYLHELMDVDLESPASVLTIVRELGGLQVRDIGTPWASGPMWSGRPVWGSVVETAKVSAGHAATLGVNEGLVVSSVEFAAVASALRDAARTLWALQDVIDERTLLELWEGDRGVLEMGMDGATLRTRDLLNAGLAVFHPRLFTGPVKSVDAVYPTLHNVLCLEMFNDYALGSTYRRCAKCGRVFVRQRGRSQFGENKRKGRVIYCTQRCQNAAQQAKHRERMKAKKKGGE